LDDLVLNAEAMQVRVKDPLVVILPVDHHLASRKAIRAVDLVGEPFVAVSDTAPVLRAVIDNFDFAVETQPAASLRA
jgi:hypothetical protein